MNDRINKVRFIWDGSDDDDEEMDVKPSVTKKRRSQLRTKLEKHEMLTLSSSSEGEQDNDNDDDGLAPLSPRVADRKPVLVNKGKGRAIEPDELPPAKKHKTKGYLRSLFLASDY